MKAWTVNRIGAPGEVMELAEIASPVAGPGSLHVRVLVAGISLPEVLMCHDTYEFKPTRPFTPGHEAVGIVLDTGGSPGFEVGQRVMGVSGFIQGSGAHAEETLLLASASSIVPEAMTDEEAAAFTIGYQTAYIGLVLRAGLREGETLLVHGAAGGTGFPAVQLGKALGARVIAVARGAEKVAACQRDGADCVIDSSAGDWVHAVNEASGESRVDVVYDPVGGEVFNRSIECLAYGGRLVAIGFASGEWGSIPTWQLVRQNASIVGALAVPPDAEEARKMARALSEWYERGQLTPRVSQVYAFAEIPKALTELDERRAFGKQVARVSS